LTQARTVMTSEPKRTLWSTGASNFETRAVSLSSPWSSATVSARAGTAASASAAPNARQEARTIYFWPGFL